MCCCPHGGGGHVASRTADPGVEVEVDWRPALELDVAGVAGWPDDPIEIHVPGVWDQAEAVVMVLVVILFIVRPPHSPLGAPTGELGAQMNLK